MRKPLPILEEDTPLWANLAYQKAIREYAFLIELEDVCRKHNMLTGPNPRSESRYLQVLDCADKPLNHYLDYYFDLLHKNLVDDLAYCGEDDE